MQGREFSLEKSTGQKNRWGRKIDRGALDPATDPSKTMVIAVIHKRQNGIEASSVLNAQ